MKNYCLSVDEIFNVLKSRELGESIECRELALEIDEAKCWNTRIICIALFFARILERDKISAQALKRRRTIATCELISKRKCLGELGSEHLGSIHHKLCDELIQGLTQPRIEL